MNKYYDHFHSAKNYNEDIQFVVEHLKKSSIENVEKIFEIGCGTGNHTLLFSKLFKRVAAFDIDPEMLECLKSKLQEGKIDNVNLHLLPLSSLQSGLMAQKFSLGCSFFNVLNYALDYRDLVTFFKTASNFLCNNGLFFFDCYKEDMFQQKIINKENIYKGEGFHFIRYIQTVYDDQKRLVTVDSKIVDYQENEEYSFVNTYKVWKEKDIEEALTVSGLGIIFHEKKQKLFSQSTYPTQDIYCVVRKEFV